MAEHLELKGDFYSIGEQLGRRKKIEVHVMLKDFKSSELHKKLSIFLATEQGAAICEQFLDTCKTHCQVYLDELRGVAHGADVTFDDLFVFNLYPEFLTILSETPEESHEVKYGHIYSGCTNLSLQTEKETYLLHTEDESPAAKDLGVMLSVEINDEEGNLLEKWTDNVVPGVIMGSKMGFNNHGLMYAANNIYQKGTNLRGIPRKFMARSVMPLRTLDEVKTKIQSFPGIATAYSWQFLTRVTNQDGTQHVLNTNIEVAGTADGSVLVEYKPGTFYHHCNIFQHLNHECHPEESSIHRAAVIGQYVLRGEVATKEDLLKIISNQQDDAFPVYRTGKWPDHLATEATGVFEPMKGTLSIYTDKPSQSNPTLIFKI